ncbi:hypothetical protein DFH08DRAFT_1049759 [Mycena albidolilacea]|uniref:Uncharacterized protein n=1 Tax=Mycena albidolilacea TaxID=1033008 RepID=A0AAD6Z7B2_9AGAR|nr:hypothetical protein DFH08DRAFT_1049759 [Mycena albidolilacea]
MSVCERIPYLYPAAAVLSPQDNSPWTADGGGEATKWRCTIWRWGKHTHTKPRRFVKETIDASYTGLKESTINRLFLPYPTEWETFIHDRKTAGISRKLNNIFSLTAIGVCDGDFIKFADGISAVNLAGGRTYHRMLPAHEGQHAIRWFIHDPSAMFTKGAEMDIPHSWIDSALKGLERVNPYIAELENLKFYPNLDNDDIALHIEHSDGISDEVAAIVSLAPASPPSRRKLVIRRKGQAEPVFLDLLSPFVEPLHYLMLLPHGTLVVCNAPYLQEHQIQPVAMVSDTVLHECGADVHIFSIK